MTLWNASAADRTHSWDVTYTAHREFSKVSKNSLATPRTSISEKSHDDESDVFPFLHSGPQVHGNGAHKGERQTSPLSRCGNVLIASFTPCSWHTVPTTEYYIYDDDGRNNKHWNSKLKRRRRTVNRIFFFLFLLCVDRRDSTSLNRPLSIYGEPSGEQSEVRKAPLTIRYFWGYSLSRDDCVLSRHTALFFFLLLLHRTRPQRWIDKEFRLLSLTLGFSVDR